ncbi:hypothetical protein SAY86_026740 [Trapa natans]|uniref:Uncharacterized protein n=1 Tax=Trapa natans TaxID=22666 RepID=A0AAN7QI29_TRANT|nr:hypothetical protein SAY86_026740 [Trapa natans]
MPVEKQNPSTCRWRFTWEAQSHIPTLKLFLFNHTTNPKRQCLDLKVDLNPSRNVVQVSFLADGGEGIPLDNPVPRVLIDHESRLSFRALDYCIDVKVALLLSVDHHLVSNCVE